MQPHENHRQRRHRRHSRRHRDNHFSASVCLWMFILCVSWVWLTGWAGCVCVCVLLSPRLLSINTLTHARNAFSGSFKSLTRLCNDKRFMTFNNGGPNVQWKMVKINLALYWEILPRSSHRRSYRMLRTLRIENLCCKIWIMSRSPWHRLHGMREPNSAVCFAYNSM